MSTVGLGCRGWRCRNGCCSLGDHYHVRMRRLACIPDQTETFPPDLACQTAPKTSQGPI